VQVRVMESTPPPIYSVMPGRVYRQETADATHLAVFHQIECLVIDRDITFANLAATIDAFTKAYFGEGFSSRLRPSSSSAGTATATGTAIATGNAVSGKSISTVMAPAAITARRDTRRRGSAERLGTTSADKAARALRRRAALSLMAARFATRA